MTCAGTSPTKTAAFDLLKDEALDIITTTITSTATSMNTGEEIILVRHLNATGFEDCVGVETLGELVNCKALCALTENLLLRLGLIDESDLIEIARHDNIQTPDKLKLYLEVLETESSSVAPFLEYEATVDAISAGNQEQILELCTWLLMHFIEDEEEQEEQKEVEEEVEEEEEEEEETNRLTELERRTSQYPSPQQYPCSTGRKVGISLVNDISTGSVDNVITTDPSLSTKRGHSPIKVSLKLESITDDKHLELAMYPIENPNERLKFLLENNISKRRSGGGRQDDDALSEEEESHRDTEASISDSLNLVLFPWKHAHKLGLKSNKFGGGKFDEGLHVDSDLGQQNSSRALNKHLTSWIRRLDVLVGCKDDEDCDIIASTKFRDGSVICKLIQHITGKKILGGIYVSSNRFEALSNIGRAFQGLWSWLSINDLHDIKRDFNFYGESIVKGNERDLWSCLHFLHKVYLKSKGINSLHKQVANTSSSAPPQNLLTFQSVVDKLLCANTEELKHGTQTWLDAMPLIFLDNGSHGGKKGPQEKTFRDGAVLCQLMSLYSPNCLYSSPTLSFNPSIELLQGRDNICVGMTALEQSLTEKMGRSQVSKVVGSIVVDKIAQGEMQATWRIFSIIKFMFEWRDGTYKSTPMNMNATSHNHNQQVGRKEEKAEAEGKITRWLIDIGLVEEGKTFAFVLSRVKAGALLSDIASKISGKRIAPIERNPATKEQREANIKRTFKHLHARIPELSKSISHMQQKLLSGEKRSWLQFLEALHRLQARKEASKAARKQQSRSAKYTRLGQRIKPESNEVESSNMDLNERTYRKLQEWINCLLYVPKNESLGVSFRDGRKLAKIIQIISKQKLSGINWTSSDHSSILQNLESILKFLAEHTYIETMEYSVHKIACGDDAGICDLLWKVKEWHRQLQQNRAKQN